MSSAIILSAASANFFWSTAVAAGGAPELELGLELVLGDKGDLGEKTCPHEAEASGGGTAASCSEFCLTCRTATSRRIRPSRPAGNILTINIFFKKTFVIFLLGIQNQLLKICPSHLKSTCNATSNDNPEYSQGRSIL